VVEALKAVHLQAVDTVAEALKAVHLQVVDTVAEALKAVHLQVAAIVAEALKAVPAAVQKDLPVVIEVKRAQTGRLGETPPDALRSSIPVKKSLTGLLLAIKTVKEKKNIFNTDDFPLSCLKRGKSYVYFKAKI